MQRLLRLLLRLLLLLLLLNVRTRHANLDTTGSAGRALERALAELVDFVVVVVLAGVMLQYVERLRAGIARQIFGRMEARHGQVIGR